MIRESNDGMDGTDGGGEGEGGTGFSDEPFK
jgi:hypothetical protein